MSNMDTPLNPDKRLLFRREKLQVVAAGTGDLVVNYSLSRDSKTYIGANNELFINDEDVTIVSIGGVILYQEAQEPPAFITNNTVYTPEPIGGEELNEPSQE